MPTRYSTSTIVTLLLSLCLIVTASLLSRPSQAAEMERPTKLTLWIHPYLPATELVRRFTPLAEYLSSKLEIPVGIRIQQSYQAHIDFVGRDLADLAFMGPASYVSMRLRYGNKPLLATVEENNQPAFHGKIIVREDSPLSDLSQLKGESFAFGDPNSTMSYFVPRAMLKKAGVELKDFSSYDFLNSHHDVALAVLGGFFSAGAVKDEVFLEYRERGLRALATSPPIPDHPFVARADLPPELLFQLSRVMLEINQDPKREHILGNIKKNITGLAPPDPAVYDALSEMMGSLNE